MSERCSFGLSEATPVGHTRTIRLSGLDPSRPAHGMLVPMAAPDFSSPTDADSIRPGSVVVTAVLVLVAAVATLGLGILASMVTACCGSSEHDGGPTAL